jgi:hypothetical protein
MELPTGPFDVALADPPWREKRDLAKETGHFVVNSLQLNGADAAETAATPGQSNLLRRFEAVGEVYLPHLDPGTGRPVGITGKRWRRIGPRDVARWERLVRQGYTLREVGRECDREHSCIRRYLSAEGMAIAAQNRIKKSRSKRPEMVGRKQNRKPIPPEIRARRDQTKKFTGLLHSAKGRALAFGVPFDLTVYDLLALWDAQDGRCLLTGLPLQLDGEKLGRTNPYSPSVDRIKPPLGYVPSNVRLITWGMNAALGEWGEETYAAIAAAYMSRRAEREGV